MKIIHYNNDDPSFSRILKLGGIGLRERMPKKTIDRPKGSENNLLMLFHDAAVITYNGALIDVKDGDAIIWRTGLRHYYGNEQTAWTHSWISISGIAAENILNTHSGITGKIIRPDKQKIFRYFEEIYSELTNYVAPDLQTVEFLFSLIIKTFHRACAEPEISIPVAIRNAEEYIRSNLHKTIRLQEIAELAGFSTTHITNIFKKYFSAPPMKYLEMQKMQKAVYLLSNKNTTIRSIAYELGYNDPLYFSRRFKKYFGIYPEHHRQSLNSKTVGQRRN